MSDADERWSYTEVRTLGGELVHRVRHCNHVPESVVPVESGGEVVATLCLTCDEQLPAEHPTAHVVPVTSFRP